MGVVKAGMEKGQQKKGSSQFWLLIKGVGSMAHFLHILVPPPHLLEMLL